MSLEECFEIRADKRISWLNEIAAKLPESERFDGLSRASNIVNNYAGVDMDALSILMYAAERGRFSEFADKLEEHHQSSLKYVHPQARRASIIPGAVRAYALFLKCYEEMGIKPAETVLV